LDIRTEAKETRIQLCLDCGKCTVVCPVARFDPEFNPRLIVQRNLSKLDPAVDDSIWSCVNCQMCLERCNYRVKFPDFIKFLRAEAVAEGVQAPCSHGAALQAMMRLMAASDIEQDRLNWLPKDIALAADADTVFFVGCAPYFDAMFAGIGVNTLEGVEGSLRLLNSAKVPFTLMANERCCGRDLLLQGDLKGFTALAEANMAEFARLGVKKIIVSCPECYETLKTDYDWQAGGAPEVVFLTELLLPLIEKGELKLDKTEQKVTYQDPCALGRGARIFDSPRKLLEASGAKLMEMEESREKALCCGASPWSHCGSVNQCIQSERLRQAEATGADLLVTACPKCQIHLKCAQHGQRSVSGIAIRDLSSILGKSLNQEVRQVGSR
jgi:heterodisulfide reductase subunit D